MPSPIILLGALLLIIIFISIARRSNRRKNIRRNIAREAREAKPVFTTDETTFTKDRMSFSGQQDTSKKTTATGVCKTCKGVKRVKCRFCHGFGSTRTTRMGAPTTISVPKVRTVFDAKGRATYQHYTEIQTKPGKIEYINQSCGPCMGRGLVKCPDC